MSEKSRKDRNGESQSTFAAQVEEASGVSEDLRRIGGNQGSSVRNLCGTWRPARP